MEPDPFPRRPPRLAFVFQRFSPLYFVTFVTGNRKPWLATRAVHEAFLAFAKIAESSNHAFVGRYVIMPDHIHLLVRGGTDFVLGRWVGALKRCLARASCRIEQVRQHSSRLWQEGFFDHLIRNNESLDEKWVYVRENPVRAGLVQRWEDWPYSGCLNMLDHADS